MDKGIFLILIVLVCYSDQRPQLDVDVATTTTDTTDPITEITKTLDKISQVTEAAAVSVQTSVNVSSKSFGSVEVFEDFKPSTYYRPDGNPIFERPSPEVTHEVFYKPEYFRRPDSPSTNQPKLKPEDKNIIFPEATQKRYSEHVQLNNKSTGPESRGPNKAKGEITVLPQTKPMKHDFGEMPVNFDYYDNSFYERQFGKHPGNEMLPSYYPDMVHEPPRTYQSSVAIHKKKNPWKSVLSVLATILPVGLLLASFPPTVIKVNSTQYPYQFQKNATSYNQNAFTGYKALRKNNAGRKINGEDGELPGYSDDCLKKKLCENIKTKYSLSELDSLLQNNKLNSTHSGPMVEIVEVAASTYNNSCRVFVCVDDKR